MIENSVAFIPKYRRKAIYGQYRADLQEIIRTLCKYKGVEILEGHKTELLYLQEFDSIEHFKAELEDYLDYYNNRRIKLKLNGLTPAMHRSQAIKAA